MSPSDRGHVPVCSADHPYQGHIFFQKIREKHVKLGDLSNLLLIQLANFPSINLQK